jgi:hypothetical protein
MQEAHAPVTLVPTKSDVERAREIRDELVSALTPVTEILTRARREGFQLQFQFGPNAFGQVTLNSLEIVKLLKLD